MSYLLDRRQKRKKYILAGFLAVLIIVLFYFRNGVFNGLASLFGTIFHPVTVAGNNVEENSSGFSSFFSSRNSLDQEIETLKAKLSENEATMSNYNSLLDENNKLKEILGRTSENSAVVLAAILSRPNQSLYDTLVIDAGTKEGIKEGDRVYALGNVPIGRVAQVYGDSAKVILFSTSREKTNVHITGQDISMEIVGRGGGNFEMILPRDIQIVKGDEVVLPGITPHVVAKVETIISDPRDAFQKALLVSPVNIQELKFVEVGI